MENPVPAATDRVRVAVADALRRVGPPESFVERIVAVRHAGDDRSDEAA